MKGRVKWWNNEKGYGFIEYNDNEDIFAYVLKEDNYNLDENQEILFKIEENNNLKILKIIE